MTLAPFGARLHAAQEERGPLCVGLDPHPSLLHDWGLPDDATGLAVFALTVIEALGSEVAVFKPQSAFFERHGSRGIAVLERVIEAGRAAGALVLLDVKRGDMGSTMQGYADAYLDPQSPLFADAVTLSPYLGFGSLQPALDRAAANGAGVFVLALTSNPEGAQVQRAIGEDGRTVAQTMLDEVSRCNVGAEPLGSVGLVIGATLRDRVDGLDAVNGPLLAPGIGTQGGQPEDLPRIFGDVVASVVPAVSREVLAAGPTLVGLRSAAAELNDRCRAVRAAASAR
jgi:orotidine-5'-phosphate decarboxylase